MKFPKLTGEHIHSKKKDKKEEYNSATSRAVDIVTISTDGTVTGIEVKTSDQEARLKRSRDQEARDIYALGKKAQILDPVTGEKHTPTSVDRVVGKPPDCDDEDHRKQDEKKRRTPAAVKDVQKAVEEDPGVEVEPPNTDSRPQPQDYRSPVGSEKDSEEDPEVDVERRRPKPRNINPPRFNVPVRPPAIESPKPIDAPARPPARPPIDDAPARPPAGPPARPPVSTTLLSGVSKVFRPLGVVTDVIDLKNAYDEDGGFGKNFQETAGGVAGGLAGAAAGAAIGTAVIPIPIVGTVLGGIAGGIIGSGAGEGIVKGVRDFFG
jgi:hypothetical protein